MKQTKNKLATEMELFPAEAKAMVAERKCLDCKKQVERKERYRRGLCDACYQTALREIADGPPGKERQLIAAGLLAPKTKGGRPRKRPSAIREFLHRIDKSTGKDIDREAHQTKKRRKDN